MSNLLKSKFFLGALIVTVMVVGFAAVATTASADCSINSTLRQGSTGAEVVCLQTSLGGLTADGAFGPMTKAAVVHWQSISGLTADGVFGPLSRAVWMANAGNSANFPAGCVSATGFSTTTGAACSGGVSTLPAGCSSTAGFSPTTGMACNVVSTLPAGCSTTAGFSPTTGMSCAGTGSPSGPLAGTAGNVAFTQLSQYSSEELGSGQTDVKIAGFELEASDGDVAIKSFKLTLDDTGYEAGDSTRIVDYLDSVTIWQGSTEIGTANTADFTRDSSAVYSKVVSVSGAVVRDGDTEKFYITADANGNIDSEDLDLDSWTIDIVNVRYEDGSGVVSTDTITLTPIPISFVSTSSASDTELKISLNNTPSAGSVQVDANENTDVVLLKGKFTVEGTSDVWMDTLPITLTSTETAGSTAAMTGSLTLTLGSNTYSESVNATNCVATADFTTLEDCTDTATTPSGVLFDNIDYTIPAGSTVNFTVTADINDINDSGVEATDFDEGDSLKAEFTVASRGLAAFVVENEVGDSLAAGEKSGSALGEDQVFYSNGVNATMGTVTYESVTDGSDTTQVTYNIPMTLTAFGDTRYIGLSADEEEVYTLITDGKSVSYAAQLSSAPTADIVQGNSTTTDTWSCDATIEGGTAYRLDEGDAVSCTLQVVLTTATGVPGSFRIHVEGIQTNSLAALTDGATELIQLLAPAEDFETGYKFLTN